MLSTPVCHFVNVFRRFMKKANVKEAREDNLSITYCRLLQFIVYHWTGKTWIVVYSCSYTRIANVYYGHIMLW